MSESRRFLRYLFPGIVFLVELGTLYALSDWKATKAAAEWLFDGQKDVVAAVSLVVLSGGLGVVFSHIHHVLHWTVWRGFRLGAHHRGIVNRLNNEIRPPGLVGSDEARADIEAVLRHVDGLGWRRDWVALTALWYMRVKRSPRIEGATQRTVELSDLVHSSGTILVASIFAVGYWAIEVGVWRWNWTWDRSGRAWLVAAFLLAFHGGGYWWTSRLARDTIEAILFTDLGTEPIERGEPPLPSQL